MVCGSNNPKDGWKAFVVAFSGSILQAVAFGVSNSYPSFLDSMMADERLGNVSMKTLSLGSSISLGLFPLMGVLAGYLVDRLGTRFTSFVSVFFLLICLILTAAVANSGVSLIFTYGLLMSVCLGFMMSPGVTATSTWFDKHMSIGMGVCFTGPGTGSLIIPNIAGVLLGYYDWRKTFYILTIMCIFNFVASFFVCIRPNDPESAVNDSNAPTTTEEEVKDTSDPNRPFNINMDKASWSQLILKGYFSMNFVALFLGYVFFSYAFYMLLFIVVPYPLTIGKSDTIYANDKEITLIQASMCFLTLGVAEVIFGPLLGYIATRSDARIVYIASMGLMALCCAFYAVCREAWEFILIFFFFGVAVVGFFATYGAMLGERFFGPNISMLMSVGFAAPVLSGFFGSLTAAAMLAANGNNFTSVCVVMSILSSIAGFLIMFFVSDAPKYPAPAPAKEDEKIENEDEKIEP